GRGQAGWPGSRTSCRRRGCPTYRAAPASSRTERRYLNPAGLSPTSCSATISLSAACGVRETGGPRRPAGDSVRCPAAAPLQVLHDDTTPLRVVCGGLRRAGVRLAYRVEAEPARGGETSGPRLRLPEQDRSEARPAA